MSDLGHLFIIIGLIFDFFGTLSLLRMPDIYSCLQAAAKCVTLGTCSILLGVFLCSGISSTGFKAFMVMAFLILTSPVSVHALVLGVYKSGIRLPEDSVCDRYADDKNKKIAH